MTKICGVEFLGAVLSVAAGATTTLGGHAVGNGGDAVVCPGDKGRSQVEFFDLYEGRSLAEQLPKLDAASSLEGKLEIAIQRLERLSPLRAALYRAQARSFFTETRFLRGQTLVDVPDSFEVALPTGCHLEQLAIQREPLSVGDPRYVVNGDLWDLLDVDSRAALVLHEIIYREAVTYYHLDSKRVRYFNRLLLSDGLTGLRRQDEWMNFLGRTMRFLRTDAGGVWIRLATCGQEVTDAEGRVRCALPLTESTLMFHPNGVLWNAPLDLESPSRVRIGDFELTLTPRCTDIGFHPTGAIAALCESRRDAFVRESSFDIATPFFAPVHNASWSVEGRLRSLVLQSAADLPAPTRDILVVGWREAVAVEGDSALLTVPWYVETRFREGRWLQTATLAEATELFDTTGRRRHLAAGARVDFNSAGRVLNCVATPYARNSRNPCDN